MSCRDKQPLREGQKPKPCDPERNNPGPTTSLLLTTSNSSAMLGEGYEITANGPKQRYGDTEGRVQAKLFAPRAGTIKMLGPEF